MRNASLLTPNAVDRLERRSAWLEREEHVRRGRVWRRRAVVAAAPAALLIGIVAVSLRYDGAGWRGLRPVAVSIGLASPAPLAVAPRPDAAAFTAVTEKVAVAEAAGSDTPPARRDLQRTTAETPRHARHGARRSREQLAIVPRSPAARGNQKDSDVEVTEKAIERNDRIAALDAIRDLRLR